MITKRNTLTVKGTIAVNESAEGETIEQQIERLITNKEPLKGDSPLTYTERKEGVRAETNIRTDRWGIAVEATDKIARSYAARREERAAPRAEGKVEGNDGGPEPIQGKTPGGTGGNSK